MDHLMRTTPEEAALAAAEELREIAMPEEVEGLTWHWAEEALAVHARAAMAVLRLRGALKCSRQLEPFLQRKQPAWGLTTACRCRSQERLLLRRWWHRPAGCAARTIS